MTQSNKKTPENKQASKFIIAMKDFIENITIGEVKDTGKSRIKMELLDDYFHKVSRILNDMDYIRKKNDIKD